MGKKQHRIMIPNHLWVWAQRMSGMQNPAPWIRDRLEEGFMQTYAPTTPQPEFPAEILSVVEQRRDALGLGSIPVDPRFASAWEAFWPQFGSPEKALDYLEVPRGINNLRGWLINWHDQQLRAV